ncbi:MAG: DUF2889 domain-containing protein [Rhodopila sp.]|nr:DUF2889 domain-containing protein [Rhodopila sp.]
MPHSRVTPSTPSPSDVDVTREELHSRHIEMRGYRRSDGLFEVEGRVTDRKPHDFVPGGIGEMVPANRPIHDMGVRLVFDEQMVVLGVHTFSDAVPYAACIGGGEALQALKGLHISNGWSREVRSRLGGARSCTHLMELLIPMATAAFQSMTVTRKGHPERLDAHGRPTKIDSCYAYAAHRDLVQQRWPAFHRPLPPEE